MCVDLCIDMCVDMCIDMCVWDVCRAYVYSRSAHSLH